MPARVFNIPCVIYNIELNTALTKDAQRGSCFGSGSEAARVVCHLNISHGLRRNMAVGAWSQAYWAWYAPCRLRLMLDIVPLAPPPTQEPVWPAYPWLRSPEEERTEMIHVPSTRTMFQTAFQACKLTASRKETPDPSLTRSRPRLWPLPLVVSAGFHRSFGSSVRPSC
jgi:hypothetical protein